MLLAKGDTRIHQRLKLGFIVVVTGQIAPAGQLGNLVAYQTLFVEPIAQAFVDPRRVVR
ncbi:hypothetical protein [Photorhabdus namnaonensis]|uniref:hypothetical protein n=1 Tax=Photorhabdus namnaonensis TaxID=1851568 RepID=UPI0013F4DB34|nr:hypothetical protein [Photorhabdus namnaonensis]